MTRMPFSLIGRVLLCISVFSVAPNLMSQVSNQLNTGYPENGVFRGTDIETVQMNNGNLHVEIPIFSAKGRGLNVASKLLYNSKSWIFHTRCFTSGGGFCEDDVQGDPLGYTTLTFAGAFDYMFHTSSRTCQPGTGLPFNNYVGGYILREPDGTKHHFAPDVLSETACVPPHYVPIVYADDGSGWMMQINTADGSPIAAISKSGEKIIASCDLCATNIPASQIVDANGNQLIPAPTCCATSGLGGTDTLGRTIPANGGYYDSSGTLQTPTLSGSASVAIDTTGLCVFSTADTCVPDKNTWTLPTQLQLPNGDVFTFTYAQNGGGELASVTLPTGGQISWTWGGWGEGGRNIASRTVTANGVTGTWNYNMGVDGGGVVTDPAQKDTRYTCGSGTCAKIEYFDGTAGSSTLLKTVTTDYAQVVTLNQDSLSSDNSPGFLPIRETTTWNQLSLSMKTETDWDTQVISGVGTVSWHNAIEKRAFDWGSNPTQLPLLERTHSSFRHLESDGQAYFNANIADLPTLIQTYDGAGNLLAQTKDSYDGSAVAGTGVCQGSGVPSHDYCNYGSGNLVRGNVTQMSRWVNTSNTWVSTNNTYDDLGNMLSTSDPLNHTTNFDYTDSWGGSGCVTASNTRAFQTTVTNPKNQRVKTSYFPCTSQVQNKQDENDIVAGRPGTSYTYDLMNRPLTIQTLDAGSQILAKTSWTYNDSVLPLTITKTVTASPSPDIVSTIVVDGLGRTSQTIQNDPEGNVTSETTYDSFGRVASVTNPHRSVTASTDGTTQYAYDTLGRTTDVIKPDLNTIHTDYAGNSTTVTDETQRQRRSVTDGLGRLIEVDEPGSSFAGVQATGSLAINGTLQTHGATSGTPGTGSVTISGAEQSKSGVGSAPGTPGTATISFSSSIPGASTQCLPDNSVCDQGNVYTTINGFTDTTFWPNGSFIGYPVQYLANTINQDNPYVTASFNGNLYSPAITVTAKTVGANTNYSFTGGSNSSYDGQSCTDSSGNLYSPCFPTPFITASLSGTTLTGGTNANPGTTVYDSGTCTVTVNGTNYSASFGQGATTSSIASALANSISAGSLASASASGATVSLTAKTVGTASNYSLSGGNCSFNSSYFSGPSFAANPSGSTLTGGTNGTPAVTDAGTVTVTIGSFQASVQYGQSTNSTSSAVASALATGLSASSSPVTATASGSSINIVYKTVGVAGDVAVSCTSSTSQGTYFSSPSFTCGGITLSGGQDSYPSGLTHPYVTLYNYDGLGNLLCVEQHGNTSGTGCSSAPANDATSSWRVRRFIYDSLSRLVSAKNPETGQATYQYDNDSTLISKTDARGVTINYTPDALHRVTQKNYSDGTPTATYQYDTGCCGVTPGNPAGRMTAAFSGNTELVFSYDPMGRIQTQWDCPPSGIARGFCYVISAQYDDTGKITSLTYPDNRVVTTGYNAAGHFLRTDLASFNGTAVNFNYYAVPQGSSPTNWGYWPSGAMNRGTYGNGVIETTGYNNRLQVSSIVDAEGGAAFFSKNYAYVDGSGHNNGNILTIADVLNSAKTQTFTYDSLNRIVTGAQADNAFNLNYSYDPWGNMKESGTSTFQPLFDVTNRMLPSGGCSPNPSPYCYDPAGDLLMDNHNNAYTYDGEARIKTVNGAAAAYTYNALGNRVRKDAGGTSTEYFFFAGTVIAELNPNTTAWTDYIGYGKRIVKDTSNNGTGAQYYHADHLGSARVMTDNAGVVISNCTYNPFGEEVGCSPNNASNHYRFNGKERDSESGLDDFGARYFSSSMGRWATPDWDARPVTVPYADFGDPQSLNLYLYVRNDPVSRADADGHISNESGGKSCLDDFMCTVQYEEHMKDNELGGWFSVTLGTGDSDDASSDGSQGANQQQNGNSTAQNNNQAGSRPLNDAERTALDPFLTKDVRDKARIHNGKPWYLRLWDKVHKESADAAVTIGNDIYFPKGAYKGDTNQDLAWLAHELFHVSQYQSGELTRAKYLEEARKHGTGPGNKYEDEASVFQDNVYRILQGAVTQGDRELGP